MSGLKAALHTAEGAAEELRAKAFLVTTYLQETPPWLKRVIAGAEQAGSELRFAIDQLEREEF